MKTTDKAVRLLAKFADFAMANCWPKASIGNRIRDLRVVYLLLMVVGLFFLSPINWASAEVHKVGVAFQFGLAHLPLRVMQEQHLMEKQAKARGINDLQVTWTQFSGASAVIDALLAGRVNFVPGGIPGLLKLWEKTKGRLGVKGVCAMVSLPMYLNTRNPAVKTIKDFTNEDKIALPSVKISSQALILEMAAAQTWGDAHYAQLDPITVSMPHPQGMAALLSGVGGIDSHLTSPPYQYQELKHPGIHTVLTSNDVLGGSSTFNGIWATSKFRDDNPETYAIFVAAFREAEEFINTNKAAAAKIYVRVSKSKETANDILELLNKPEIKFTMTPENTIKYADFMYKIGTLKTKPSSWKDYFFPEVHNLPGS